MRSSKVLYLLVAALALLLSCSDDDPVQPDPIAEFTYTSTNGQNAPTEVSFFNTVEIDVLYMWDFGNGETFEGRDPVILFAEEGTYTVTLTASNASGSAQQTTDIVVGPLNLSANHMEGTWSIVREEVTMPGSSTPVVYERPLNWSTLRYESNGAYQRVNLDWVELERGTFSMNSNMISQTPTEGNDDFPTMDILITSFDGSSITAETEMVEPGVGTIQIDVTLEKLGSEYFGQGDFPIPSIRDFAASKWSILEEATTYYGYSSLTNEYTEVLGTETVTGIPYGFNTFDATPGIKSCLFIDNWGTGTYESYFRLMQVETYSTYWIDVEEEGDEIIVLITNNLDGDNIETTSVGFFEDEGEEVKFETVSRMRRIDSSVPTVTEDDIVGQWEVTAKTETEEGVDKIHPSTPPVGAVIIFHADGSAELGDPSPGSWYILDNSNFVVVSPDGDETIVHVTGHNATTGELSSFSRWIENEALWEMTLSLSKK